MVQDEQIFALQIFFLVLPWIVGALRMWARYLRNQRPQTSDWLLLAALISLVGQTTSAALQQVYIPGPNHSTPLEIPTTLFWGIALFFVKMSILTFYASLFAISPTFRKACHVMMHTVSIYTVLYITVALLSCIPVQKLIDKSIPGACIDISTRIIGFTAANLATDIILAIMPLPMVWKLHTSVSKRVLLTAIFCAAFGVCAISAVRMAYLSNHAPYLARAYGLFTLLEPDLGAVVACLPLLWPIFRPIGNRLRFMRVGTPTDIVDVPAEEKDDRQAQTLAGRPILRTHNARANDMTASQRLNEHLYHIPEMGTGKDRASRGDLESAVHAAADRSSAEEGDDEQNLTATRRWNIEE